MEPRAPVGVLPTTMPSAPAASALSIFTANAQVPRST